MKLPVLMVLVLVWALSLGACANVPAQRGEPDGMVCPIVPMQGNGGTTDRCQQVPVGCTCQQM